MSVGEEQTECPLCMEPLEMDDINFFPCTCGYQICRFCWHRLRTYENGLCPACRKAYPEDPAEFKPLTDDELQRIKRERRQKDLQRKQKAAENRKHLANVRVVQRNLVFVVGLSQRLADPEVLKKHEYFGKFGKIHKVVINQSTSYAGAQGPSASAYVTYNRPEDALRAIQAVNNVFVDGRTLKASLGTTKYCSHFLKGAQCPKQDCMYLHELGEEAASFTKEEMQQGKHQEYEQKLYEQFMNSQNAAHHSSKSPSGQTSTPVATTTATTTNTTTANTQNTARKKTQSPTSEPQQQQQQQQQTSTTQPPQQQQQTQPPPPHSLYPPNTANKEAWPSLQVGNGKPQERLLTNGNGKPPSPPQQKLVENNHRAPGANRQPRVKLEQHAPVLQTELNSKLTDRAEEVKPSLHNHIGANYKRPFFETGNEHLSLFSGNGFPTSRPPTKPVVSPPTTLLQSQEEPLQRSEIPESIPVCSTTDWQTAFGLNTATIDSKDKEDDLGFDPWDESTKALADLIQHEEASCNTSRSVPPGFSASCFNPMKSDQQQTRQNDCHNREVPESFKKNWQDGLRALLPNINISFGNPELNQMPPGRPNLSQSHKPWPGHHQVQDRSWMAQDPAILSASGSGPTSKPDETPHWMRSLHQLTEIDSHTSPHNHRLPFVQNFQFRGPSWPHQSGQNPPPGFQAPIPEPHTLTEGLQ